MPQAPLTRAEAERRINAVNKAIKAGYTPPGQAVRPGDVSAVTVAAKALKFSPGSLHSSIGRIKQVFGLVPDVSLAPAASEVNIEPHVKRKMSDTLRDRDKRIATLERALATAQELRRTAFGLADEMTGYVPASFPQTKGKAKHAPQTAVLVISDEQAGENISAAQIDFPNDYNAAIYRKRIRRVFDTAIKLAQIHDSGVDYEGLILAWIGDAISGDIHQDLAETQELTAPEQVVMVAEEMISGIQALLEAKRPDGKPLFPLIRLIFVPGNHDRDTMKPRSKSYVGHSLTIMALYAIESHFKARIAAGDKMAGRLQVFGSKSGDVQVQIYHQTVLFTHGDRMGSRGGKGFVGAEATILRGAHLTRKQYAGMGRPVDLIICGHWHISRDLKIVIVNGSIAGPGEYSMRELRAEPEEPSQTMLFFERDRGLISRRIIFVEPSQRLASNDVPLVPAFNRAA
jgi:predicted phosphodiesterase